MKNFHRFFLLLMMTTCLSVPASARTPSPYGPQGKRFGGGLHFGEPMGFTLKGYPSKQFAVDFIAAWSFVEDSFTMISDLTYEFFDIPEDVDGFTLPFYAGIGGKLAFDRGGKDRKKTLGAVRIPFGFALQLIDYPIEIFFELGPGMQFAPKTEFDMTGGVGARFYF